MQHLELEVRKSKQILQKIARFFVLLCRPFYDFYYNYGLGKASTLAYVLSANLVLFLYFVLSFNFTSAINPFHSQISSQRFLEVHFLWPMNEKILLTKSPLGFPIREGAVVTKEELQRAQKKYKTKYKKDEAVETKPYSVTQKLGISAHKGMIAFQKRNDTSSFLGVGIFFLFSIAYMALLLAIRAALAEVDTPIIRGNVPLELRASALKRIRWYLPSLGTIQNQVVLFMMIPTVSAFIVGGISFFQIQIDLHIDPYSRTNMILTLTLSFAIISALFWIFYKFSLPNISSGKLLFGACVASALWLGGRWLFSTYTAISFERSLHNFAFVPMIMSWMYYFCSVFLLGAHIAHTVEYSYLSSTSRSWSRKEVLEHSTFTRIANWIKVDFLLRLSEVYYFQGSPKKLFIRIGNKKGRFTHHDVADEIARESHMHPSFVREILSNMVAKNMKWIRGEKIIYGSSTKECLFQVEVKHRKQQVCTLMKDPKEIDVASLIHDFGSESELLKELPSYELAKIAKIARDPHACSLYELYEKALEEKVYFFKDSKKEISPIIQEETAKEETAKEETAKEETAKEETPKEETPKEETPIPMLSEKTIKKEEPSLLQDLVSIKGNQPQLAPPSEAKLLGPPKNLEVSKSDSSKMMSEKPQNSKKTI